MYKDIDDHITVLKSMVENALIERIKLYIYHCYDLHDAGLAFLHFKDNVVTNNVSLNNYKDCYSENYFWSDFILDETIEYLTKMKSVSIYSPSFNLDYQADELAHKIAKKYFTS